MLACLLQQRGTPAAVPTQRARTVSVAAYSTEKVIRSARRDDTMSSLVHEARQHPAVQVPVQSSVPPSQLFDNRAQIARNTSQDDDYIIHPSSPRAADAPEVLDGTFNQAPQQQVAHLPNRKVRPSRMDFEVMYQQLYLWKQKYLSAHVPRYCFDAPELGAWVRKMRKLYKDKELEQWRIERLNALGFEWDLTDQDARWHHLFHELRRYQLLHGTTDVDTSHSLEDGCDWPQVAWWLKKQARLLAKQKLSGRKRDMLAHLGVTLRVPKRIIKRTAQLQALNGPERRKLRKKWKKLDMEAADKIREQREQEQQQRHKKLRLQHEVANRRLALLRDAVGLSEAGDMFVGVSEDSSSSSSRDAVQGVDFQLQQFQQLSDLLQQQPLQQQQQQQQYHEAERVASSASAGSSNVGRQDRTRADVRKARGGSNSGGSSNSSSSGEPPDVSSSPAAASLVQQQQQQHTAAGTVSSTITSPSGQPQGADSDSTEQKQKQQGLLYGRNRRNKRVHTTSKQERWMSSDGRVQQQQH